MKTLRIENLGQIKEAEVTFGDFTVLVGPQASGKSIFLQMMKLVIDCVDIKETIKKFGFNWNNYKDFLNLYFGEGMEGIIKPDTNIQSDNTKYSIESLLRQKKVSTEKIFLIPAQRVITMQNGWPRNYLNFEMQDPYIVKHFSEDLRLHMESGIGSRNSGSIFPQEGRMKKSFRDKLNESIFFNAKVELDKSIKKRIMLNIEGYNLPYLVWSAGQREFMPLLLGLYSLMPSGRKTKEKDIEWVVIEEPEMGLHPLAIQSLLLTFLELITRKYKVIISTHSPVILELCWAITNIQKNSRGSADILFKLFDINKQPTIRKVFEDVLGKCKFKTFYFDRKDEGVIVKDISSLDPSHPDAAESEWGGLSSFSSRVSDIISKLYSE